MADPVVTKIGGGSRFSADMPGAYDYNSAGFDDFLSRSIGTAQVGTYTLGNMSGGSGSNAINFDQASVSGSMGDTITVGKIIIDGVNGRISVMDDAGNEVVRLGELDG